MGRETQFHKDGEMKCVRATNSKIIASFGTQSRMKLDDIEKKIKNQKLFGLFFLLVISTGLKNK